MLNTGRLLRGFLIAFIILSVFEPGYSQQKEKFLIRIHPIQKSDIEKLEDLDLDYAYRGLKKYVDVIVDQIQLETIRSRGYRYEILPAINKTNLYDPEYHTYEEVVQELDFLSSTYQDIAKVYQIGASQRYQIPIYAIKISDNVEIDEDEFTVNYEGMHHAREPIGMEICMALINHLLNNYGIDSQITHLIDNIEIWIVPILNTEGYKYIVDNDLSSPYWRKNQRDNDLNGQFNPNNDGVDLNRNYSYNFTRGGSTDFTSWTYRGLYPFSESETQAKRDLALIHRFLCSISYHSSGEQINYMDGLRGSTIPETPIINAYVDSIASRITTLARDGTYALAPRSSMGNESYPWMFAVLGAYEVLIETGTSFIPTGNEALTVAQDNVPGAMYLLEKTISGPGIKGNIIDSVTNDPIVANVKIKEYFRSGMTVRKSEAGYGRFHRFAEPGFYTLEISASGYASKIIENIEVLNSGWTDVQVALDWGGIPVVFSYTIDDDSLGESIGNNNGIANINETIEFKLSLKNVGRADLGDFSAKIVSLSSHAVVLEDTRQFGPIPMDSVSLSMENFIIKIDQYAPDGFELPIRVQFLDSIGFIAEDVFTIPVAAPLLDFFGFVVHDSTGNNNGALEPGEIADLEIIITNNGHMDVNFVRSVITAYSGYFEYIERYDTCDVIKIAEQKSLLFTVKLSDTAPDPYLAEMKISMITLEKYIKSHSFLLYCVAGFFDNMEQRNSGWWSEVRGNPANAHNDWQWGNPYGDAGGQDPVNAYSGRNCWGNDLGGEGSNGYYQPGVNVFLHSPVIDCSRYNNIGLRFMRRLNVRDDDYAAVWINDTSVWNNNYNGIFDNQWQEQVIDISSFADGKDSLIVSFQLMSNEDSFWAGGWNIDDVLVKDNLLTEISSLSNEKIPIQFELEQNYPNPFNSETTIHYQLPKRGNVLLAVFNIRGQEIIRLLDKIQDTGKYNIIWNGKDNNKIDVSSGIYFVKYKVKTEAEGTIFRQTKKIMLIR